MKKPVQSPCCSSLVAALAIPALAPAPRKPPERMVSSFSAMPRRARSSSHPRNGTLPARPGSPIRTGSRARRRRPGDWHEGRGRRPLAHPPSCAASSVRRLHRHSFALAGHGSVLAVHEPHAADAGAVGHCHRAGHEATRLSDDDGNEHVDDKPGALRRVARHGAHAGRDDAPTGRRRVSRPASPSPLVASTVPALAPGTPVEARVTLGPDPANPDAIVLTLVAAPRRGRPNGDRSTTVTRVKAEGQVTAVTEAGAAGAMRVDRSRSRASTARSRSSFRPGFGATGVIVGDEVEARRHSARATRGRPADPRRASTAIRD